MNKFYKDLMVTNWLPILDTMLTTALSTGKDKEVVKVLDAYLSRLLISQDKE